MMEEMTREEAADKLGDLAERLTDDLFDTYVEPLAMAIKALQEPERRRGKWIKAYPTNPDVWMCSECHYIDEPKWAYCRNCGAEMEVEYETN